MLRVIDLFCGCGGLSCGFRKGGIEVVRGFDNWPIAIDNYNANLPEEAERLDLSDVALTREAIERRWDEDRVDGIIGGPPCQDFSSAGKRVEGSRADLTEKYASVVAHFLPSFFVMENVARAQHAAAFHRAIDTMRDAGYGITAQVLNASLYGVPQNRKRLITVGFLGANQDDSFREVLLAGASDHPMTMREYFGDSLGTEYVYRHPRSYARRAVFSIDEPCPTVRGVNRPIPPSYPGHPGDAGPLSEARPLTFAERARVQTFEGYEWHGTKTSLEQMIGNAVPVNLARHVAEAIREYLGDDGTAGDPDGRTDD